MELTNKEKQTILDSFVLANRTNIREELIKQGWNPEYINIPRYQQDLYGSTYTDPETQKEIIVPPTFNWSSIITSQKLSNNEYFYCSLVFLDKEFESNITSNIFKILDEDFKNAIETMKDFSLCKCEANNPCKEHRSL